MRIGGPVAGYPQGLEPNRFAGRAGVKPAFGQSQAVPPETRHQPSGFLETFRAIGRRLWPGASGTAMTARKEAALARINRPMMTDDHLSAWLDQFEPADRPTALKLVENVRFVTYPELREDTRRMHGKLLKSLARDGFIDKANGQRDFDNVDFAQIYTAKSGGVVSYVYRKANKIPNDLFKTLDQLRNDLQQEPAGKSGKALVILDDYIGTGTQFLTEMYALQAHDVMDQYGKIYFVVDTAHEKAVTRFRQLAAGDSQAVVDAILTDFHMDDDAYKTACETHLKKLAGNRLELIFDQEEVPLLSPRNTAITPEDRAELKAFLEKYNVYKYPFGVGQSQGHTAFYYSAPNTLPDMLWNSKSRRQDGSAWLPLFDRTEDMSIYWAARHIPRKAQVW